MYYIVYKTTNTVNGKFYIGAHRTKNKEDSYLGSGVALKQAIMKYGKESFIRETIAECQTEDEMYDLEKKLISEILSSEESYNMSEGGKGGWSHIDNRGSNNPMKNPLIKNKCITRMKETKRKDPKYKSIALNNLQKAIETNTGKTRPDHSEKMKQLSRVIWSNPETKEKFKDSRNNWFELTSPEGEVTRTNRLTEFCKMMGFPFVSIWSNTKKETPISKGKAKGWSCKIIQN